MRPYNKEIKKSMLKLVLQELGEDPFYKFKLVFAIMSIIPLLTFVYLVFEAFSRIGMNFSHISLILFILIVISILGFFFGYSTIKNLLNKIIFYTSEIKRSEQIQAELAASVSHDFKTPISIIKESLHNMAGGSLGSVTDVQKERLGSCQSTLDNLRNTIDTLLDLYKVEAGMVELKKEPCNLSDLLSEKITEFGILFEKKKIAVTNKGFEKGLFARVDKDKIKEVFNNLLSNSLKYTPDSGWVDLSISGAGEFIRIEFSNSSEIIPDDKLNTIFEKFKRLDNAKEGTGLGLAIAKDIIELHGGDLWAENIPAKGVKFVIILPRS